MATRPADRPEPLERGVQRDPMLVRALGWQTRRTFRLFGLRILIQTTPHAQDCPQCQGHGTWRPPYALERVPCDLCTPAQLKGGAA